MIKFPFNQKRATEAAAYLLRLSGGRKDYGSLLKLLYLADRVSLIEVGCPITGDTMVSMEHGTTLSHLYDIIKKENNTVVTSWSQYISRPDKNKRVKLIAEPPKNELSKYEIKVLGRVHREHGDKSFSQLRNYTHHLEEWENPGKSSAVINPEKILKIAGKKEKEISEIKIYARELALMS